eukprot:TRINITY_DN49854_c0_g1_i1.p1 TRINITY_DN49854_c0_g1~~TRINITY_DN49854_c0_g1_i1.p1  ORF type:complete len:226 (-),score=33.24 TRINITY_DN49854_c0_g1_i1:87-743(-)
MTSTNEPLLPISAPDAPSRNSNGRMMLTVLTVGIAFLAGVYTGPTLTEASKRASTGITELAEGPLGLGGIFGPLGEAMGRLYDVFKPFAWSFRLSGVILYVAVFLLAGIHHLMDFKNFVGMVRGLGVPCPTFAAGCGILFMLLGSILMLTGKPVLMEWGAEFLGMFLIMATCFGHVKPWIQAGAASGDVHFLMIMKNISLFGTCLLIIGYEIPKIGPS